jgi:hypothetical protein
MGDAHTLGEIARLGERGSPRPGFRSDSRFGIAPRTAR